MNKFAPAKRIAALACLVLIQQSAMANDTNLQQARQLLAGKKASEAYALLAPLQSQRAGEPAYDYLLGIAALDSGKATEAVFALERFLVAEPGNGPARLELARAYYMLGESTASRREFETVKRQQPPEQVNQAIQSYLSSINQIAASQGSTIRGYIEMLAGHDSNANSATSSNQIAVPALGGMIGLLAPASRRRDDNFAGLASGISARQMMSADTAINMSANISQRYHDKFSQYDIGYLDTSLGLSRIHGIDQYTGAFQYQKLMVDRDSYRSVFGLLGQWQRTIDDQRLMTAYTQISRLEYSGPQSVRDADRYVVGAAFSQALSRAYTPVVYTGIYIGRENARRANVAHLDNKIAGLRVGGQLNISASFRLIANASLEKRRYGANEPFFLRRRSDRQTDFSLGGSYSPALYWTIRPEVIATRNRSNIVLNDYSRTQYLVTVRRDFN